MGLDKGSCAGGISLAVVSSVCKYFWDFISKAEYILEDVVIALQSVPAKPVAQHDDCLPWILVGLFCGISCGLLLGIRISRPPAAPVRIERIGGSLPPPRIDPTVSVVRNVDLPAVAASVPHISVHGLRRRAVDASDW